MQKILAAIRNKDIDTQSWVGPQILKEKLQHFGESDRFPEPLEVLCQQVRLLLACGLLVQCVDASRAVACHKQSIQAIKPHTDRARESRSDDSATCLECQRTDECRLHHRVTDTK